MGTTVSVLGLPSQSTMRGAAGNTTSFSQSPGALKSKGEVSGPRPPKAVGGCVWFWSCNSIMPLLTVFTVRLCAHVPLFLIILGWGPRLQ